MNREDSRFTLPTAVLLFAAALTGCATAPDDSAQSRAVEVRRAIFPADIDSLPSAEIALEKAASERERVETEFVQAQRACHDRFFMTACLDQAKERRRARVAGIRVLEIEANAFSRRFRAAERDKALADKRDKDDAKAAEKSGAAGAGGADASGQAGSGQPAPAPSMPRSDQK